MDNEQTIGKAIVFIENNLYEPIAACDVARAVSYSYYHFHRYFQAVMGIRFKTTAVGNDCVSMWEQFNQQITELNNPFFFSNRRYSVFEGSETCSSNAFSADSETTAFIGVEISADYPISGGMQKKEFCGGKYAKFIHKGAVNTLLQTYHYIWGVWFPKSGCKLANRDDFECYTERFVGADSENSEIDIYFPII